MPTMMLIPATVLIITTNLPGGMVPALVEAFGEADWNLIRMLPTGQAQLLNILIMDQSGSGKLEDAIIVFETI